MSLLNLARDIKIRLVMTEISKEQVIEALGKVEDPELFLDIWFLGLVYGIELDDSLVKIQMTFTSPMCPMGPEIVSDVKDKVGELEGVEEVDVEIVFTPPWEPNDEVKALMGYM